MISIYTFIFFLFRFTFLFSSSVSLHSTFAIKVNMAALLLAISHQIQDLKEHIIKLDTEIDALDHAEPRDSETVLCSIRKFQQDLEDCQQDIDTKDDAISQVIKDIRSRQKENL